MIITFLVFADLLFGFSIAFYALSRGDILFALALFAANIILHPIAYYFYLEEKRDGFNV